MAPTERSSNKPRVVRVVTAHYVVPWHLANTLERMPADFETYVVGQGVSRYRDRYPGVHWIDLELERKAAGLADLKALFDLYSVFRSIRPDIVHSIMPKAGLLAALAGFLSGVPLRMHTFTGQVWATQSGPVRWLYRSVDSLIVRLNTLCMTDSRSQSEFLLEQGIPASGLSLPVLAHGSLSGIDTDRFHPDARVRVRIRRELGIPADAPVFLYLGRLNRDKGIINLAEAFAMLTDVNAHLILAGPDEGVLSQALSILSGCRERVHVTGFVETPAQMFMAADVFCLPSRREGFGSVVIEAAACGIPTIGTRIPGLVDAIDDEETGLLCEVDNALDLASCMEVMLKDPSRRYVIGQQARLRAERLFGANLLYAHLREKYLNFLNSRNNSKFGNK